MSFSTSQLGYSYSSSPEDPGVTWVAGEPRLRHRELGRQVTGSAVRLAITLDEATDRWKAMIKYNHVTVASQSVRDTAGSIQEIIQTLRKLETETLDEMAKCQQEQEEEEKKRMEDNGGGAGCKRQKRGAQGQRSYSHAMVTVAVFLITVAVFMHNDAHLTGANSVSTGQPGTIEHEDSYRDFSSDTTSQPCNSKNEDCEKIHQEMVSEDSTPCLDMGLFNARSINNKQPRISELIKKFMLKVLILTETWVRPENGDQRLGEILPEFQFYHQPRVHKEGKPKRGGGVAIVFSKKLQGERVQFQNTSFVSFEYVAAELHYDECDRPIWIITVYRPPKVNKKDMMDNFLEEFQNLLNMCPKDISILITGDFNIKVNDENDKHAKRFKKLLDDNDLHQWVEKETHKNNNTLDLVITRNVDISNLRVKKPKTQTETRTNQRTNEVTEQNKTISDHSAVIFSAHPTSENIVKRKHTDPTDPPSKQFKDREE